MLVEGEAGIGKSRLVREFLASPAGKARKALVACCPPFHQPCTLGPVVDALRQTAGDVGVLPLSPLAGALRPVFPEWAEVLPPSPEPLEDFGAARYRLYRALAELLEYLRVRLVVAEDVHWADEATLEFLLFLAARQPHGSALLVTYRREDVPDGSLLRRLTAGTTTARIVLPPLDVAATADLVSSMLDGEPVSEAFAGFLHERTDGLPLAVEETVRLMADRADLERRADGWVRRHLADVKVPPTVRDAVLERADRVRPRALAVLRAAAVLAEPATEPVLMAVAGLAGDEARASLCEALSCGLLTEISGGQVLAFRHALAARAVYEAAPGPLRREMHHRAGRALQGIPSVTPVQLARHFREAGDVNLWCRHGEQAADLALASGDQNAAAALLCDLITAAALSPSDMARLTGKISLTALTDVHDLVSALRSVLNAGVASAGEEADVRYQLGRVLCSGDDWSAACVELERAIPDLMHDPVASARAMGLLGLPFGTDRPAAEHLRWLSRTHEVEAAMPELERLRLMVERATALLLLGEQDGWGESERAAEEATICGQQLQVIRVCLNTADAVMLWGRYAEASRVLAQGAELASQGEYGRLVDDAVIIGAHLDWFTGAWEGLAGRVERLVQADDRRSGTHTEAVLVVGLLHAVQGAGEAAIRELERLCSQQARRGLMLPALEPAAWLARLLLAEGRVGDALEVTEEPMRGLTAKGIWLWATEIVPARVQALLAADRREEASALTAAFGRGLRRRSMPAPQAALVLSRAMLAQAAGSYVRAGVLFERAADAWQRLPRPYDALLAREQQARCLLAVGERETGLARLGEVLRGLSSLGATADADLVAHTLRGYGVVARRTWHRGRLGYGDQLSPRELEVVRLVIEGHTNQSIAQTLSRSPKTVEMQLSSAKRKLGVSSRAALAVRAAEAGVVPANRQRLASPGSS